MSPPPTIRTSTFCSDDVIQQTADCKLIPGLTEGGKFKGEVSTVMMMRSRNRRDYRDFRIKSEDKITCHLRTVEEAYKLEAAEVIFDAMPTTDTEIHTENTQYLVMMHKNSKLIEFQRLLVAIPSRVSY